MNSGQYGFEVHLILLDLETGKFKLDNQYFLHNGSYYDVTSASLKWANFQLSKLKNHCLERMLVWQWWIEYPQHNGYIGTQKDKHPFFHWCFEKGIVVCDKISHKQKRKVLVAMKDFEKYRPMRMTVTLEEIFTDLSDTGIKEEKKNIKFLPINGVKVE